jgi:drug/metabolite transporter (DMT)-like permease
VFAFSGLYLLCAKQGWALNSGDALGVLCALFIAIHIIYTGRYAGTCDIYWLTTLQIGVIGLLSAGVSQVKGHTILLYYPGILHALVVCVLFATIFAYLVQTTMQRYISPSNTALIFCMEPVFAAVCAFLVTGEQLGTRGMIGAAFILFGMALSQLAAPE